MESPGLLVELVSVLQISGNIQKLAFINSLALKHSLQFRRVTPTIFLLLKLSLLSAPSRAHLHAGAPTNRTKQGRVST